MTRAVLTIVVASLCLTALGATRYYMAGPVRRAPVSAAATFLVGSGGTTTNTDGDYKIHVFSNSSTFVVSASGYVDALIIAGGGSGCAGAGGGAGGYTYTQNMFLAVDNYTIVIGNGGSGGLSGSNSTAFGLVTFGGGRGAKDSFWGATGGGSGGGGSYGYLTGGAGTNGQGFAGGNGSASGPRYGSGGGGGGGSVGANGTGSVGGNGGAGITNSITGGAVGYCGGGGGGVFDAGAATVGVGIDGGGSAGTAGANNVGQNGVAGKGGGGGGGSYIDSAGKNLYSTGGKGIVIVRYRYQ